MKVYIAFTVMALCLIIWNSKKHDESWDPANENTSKVIMLYKVSH